MASKPAKSRLLKELKVISSDPPPHIHVAVDETNILDWNYLMQGPKDTPYEGGWYWGKLRFPKDYPFKPPSILMMTPNGRFQPNTRLCLSMSDYHPETWQPAWSVATVLKGLLSFMCEDTPTAGAVDPPPPKEARQQLAASSIAWNQDQADFLRAFPQFSEIVEASRVAATPSDAGGGGYTASEAPPLAAPDPEALQEGAREPAFAPGDLVRISGLKARADLNGKEGLVQIPGPEQIQQRRILVEADGEKLGVKPENLVLLASSSR
eukprot:TRINITY_DN44480_c0_g1_i1.p1 TRINITY_DN44480_c0_g1~~TRINITY_DN44480_c0_g1_i1.p1  ORF type:complete len:266 (+),score=52.12 TRINITY_DN44480_c0_g1_i1:55-852(+)